MKIDKETANEIVKLINKNKSEGEEVTKVNISTGRNYIKNEDDFIMLFQKITEQAIKNLKPATAKIMLYMLCKLNWSNQIGIDQLTMAEECLISLPSVQRAIKELLDLHIIISIPDPQDKRRHIYLINPHQAWKGQEHRRKKAIKTLQGQLILPMPTEFLLP